MIICIVAMIIMIVSLILGGIVFAGAINEMLNWREK